MGLSMDADTLNEVVKAIVKAGWWNLLHVVRMSTCSATFRSIWQDILRQHPSPAWLVAAAADAANPQAYAAPAPGRQPAVTQTQLVKLVEWLLKACPELATAPGVAEQLLAIEGMPHDLARILCRFGVSYCFEQLVAAAGSGTAGVDVWVLAQLEEGVLDDIPPAAGPLLRGEAEAALELLHGLLIHTVEGLDLMLFIGPEHPVLGLLHLALNSSSPAAVRAAVRILPSNLQTSNICSLLRTAVSRGHQTDIIPTPPPALAAADAAAEAAGSSSSGIGVVTAMLAKLPAGMLLPLADLLPLLQLAVQLDAKVDSSRKQLPQLMRVLSYQQITAADLADLLQAAVAGSDLGNGKALLESPAAALMDAAAMLQLLHEAVGAGDDRLVAALVECPAMAQVTVQTRLPLLKAALESPNFSTSVGSTFSLLCPQEGYAAAVTEEGWLQLLLEAMAINDYQWKCMLLLLQHRATALLTTSGLLALLQAALERHIETRGMQHTLQQLWSHPAAACITVEVLLPLLESAVEQGAGVGFVCQWTPAQKLSSEQLAGLLHKALVVALERSRNSSLLSIPAGSNTGSVLQHNTEAGSNFGDIWDLAMLLQCSAEASMPADVLLGLLHKCLEARSRAIADSSSTSQAVCNHQATAGKPTLSGPPVEGLTAQLAQVSLCSSSSLQALCSCPAAANLSGEQLAGLVRTALDSRDTEAARMLCLSTTGRQFTSQVLLQLLQCVMQQSSSGSTAKTLQACNALQALGLPAAEGST